MTAAIVYINTDNLSGTENGTSLANGYVTLSQAITSETATLTQDMTMKCSGVAADTGAAIITAMTLGGFTLTVEANRDEADGFYDGDLLYSTSHYRMEYGSGFQAIKFSDDGGDIIFDGIQVKLPSGGFKKGIQLAFQTANTRIWTIKNCRIKGFGSANQDGIQALLSNNNGDAYIQNNIVFGCNGASSTGIECVWGSFFTLPKAYVTGNTVFSCEKGIQILDTNANSSAAEAVIKNNAIAKCTDDYSQGSLHASFTVTITHNASDDGDGTSSQDLSPGTPEADEWPDHWTDPNNGTDNSKDFTVVDSGALDDNGTTGTGILTTDILGTSRHASTPDIGAFEEAAGAAATGQLLQLPHHQRGGFNSMHGGFSS